MSSRLVGSGTGGALLDASKRAASRPDLGLAAVTPRLFSFEVGAFQRTRSSVGMRGRLTAFTLRSAAAAACVRRSSGDCARCRGSRCCGLPLLSMVDGGARVCPPVSVDDLEQIPPIGRDRVQLYLNSEGRVSALIQEITYVRITILPANRRALRPPACSTQLLR